MTERNIQHQLCFVTLPRKNYTGCLSDANMTSSWTSHSSDECQTVPNTSHQLWSPGKFTYADPLTKTQLDDKSFAVASPRLWNTLPVSLRLVDDLAHFKHLLKVLGSSLFLGTVHKCSYSLTHVLWTKQYDLLYRQSIVRLIAVTPNQKSVIWQMFQTINSIWSFHDTDKPANRKSTLSTMKNLWYHTD